MRYTLAKQKLWYNISKKGFATLTSVLVVGAIGLTLCGSILLIGVLSTQASLSSQQSIAAKNIAQGCAEEALQKIWEAESYTGSATLTRGSYTCSYTVTNTGSQNRTITASSTVGNSVKKVKVVIDQLSPSIRIVSWQEVADF